MAWNPVKGIRNWATGGDTSSAYNQAAIGNMMASQQAQAELDKAANIKTKSAEETMKEGMGAAGVASANKAGEAKKQAKAAATMGGANRLQSALAGASAAGQAASEGFTDTANAQAQQAAQKDLANKQAQIDIAKEKANAITSQANAAGQGLIQQKEGEANRRQQLLSTGIGALAAWSDENCKNFKRHTYIKKEDRSNANRK